MKTLLLITLLLISQANAADLTLEESAKELINVYGYTCKDVDGIIPFTLSDGFKVWCDNLRHQYILEIKGEMVTVTVL